MNGINNKIIWSHVFVLAISIKQILVIIVLFYLSLILLLFYLTKNKCYIFIVFVYTRSSYILHKMINKIWGKRISNSYSSIPTCTFSWWHIMWPVSMFRAVYAWSSLEVIPRVTSEGYKRCKLVSLSWWYNSAFTMIYVTHNRTVTGVSCGKLKHIENTAIILSLLTASICTYY